jgi:hypothetical protein
MLSAMYTECWCTRDAYSRSETGSIPHVRVTHEWHFHPLKRNTLASKIALRRSKLIDCLSFLHSTTSIHALVLSFCIDGHTELIATVSFYREPSSRYLDSLILLQRTVSVQTSRHASESRMNEMINNMQYCLQGSAGRPIHRGQAMAHKLGNWHNLEPYQPPDWVPAWLEVPNA